LFKSVVIHGYNSREILVRFAFVGFILFRRLRDIGELESMIRDNAKAQIPEKASKDLGFSHNIVLIY
jgi:hypothetical protein